MEEALSGWVRFENAMPESLKVAPIGDRAFRLWVHAICYCSRAQTDGLVPSAVITGLSATANARTVTELLDAGLVERIDGKTYLVHDYLDYNPSRARIDEMREGSRERVAKHRGKRTDHGVTADHITPLQDHYPRGRDRSVPLPAVDPVIENLCHRLAEHVRRNDPKAHPTPDSEGWRRDMRLLLADRNGDAAEIEQVIDWSQQDVFWHSNILSPAKLRKQFTQLVLKAEGGGVVRLARKESPSDIWRAINGGEAS